MQQQDNFSVNIPLSQTTPVICENCENDTFVQVLYARKVSKFLAGSSEDLTKFVPTLACSKCQHVNVELRISTILNQEDDSNG